MRSLNALVVALGAVGMLVGCGSVDTKTTDGPPARTVSCDATTHSASVLMNGSFDAATPAWMQDPPNLLCGSQTFKPFDGTTSACLGSTNGETDTLSMSIALPANAISVTLNGQKCITTEETAAVDHDTMTFELVNGGAILASIGMFSNQQGTSACSFAPFTMQAQLPADPDTATFQIRSNVDAQLTTTFLLDALALDIGCSQ
jgi:hypothetical protein